METSTSYPLLMTFPSLFGCFLLNPNLMCRMLSQTSLSWLPTTFGKMSFQSKRTMAQNSNLSKIRFKHWESKLVPIHTNKNAPLSLVIGALLTWASPFSNTLHFLKILGPHFPNRHIPNKSPTFHRYQQRVPLLHPFS